MPNHIVGKGTIRKLRELYPDANIFPVDYDAGASAVNQENRIKLMLSIARDNKAARAGHAETDGRTERGETTDNATAEAAATVSENNDNEDNL